VPSALGTDKPRTHASSATAGFALSMLGFLASLFPGDLFVAVPLLLAGLYVSVAGLRASSGKGPRRLAIAGAVIGVLGLLTTVLLFAMFIG
jgi:hypothetical protein